MAITLTPRDYEILEALNNAGYLSSPQIQKLFWRSGGNVGPVKASQRRLRLLAEHGYVRRIELSKKRQEASKPYLYALDEGGAEELSFEFGIDLYDINWKPKPAEENERFLAHLLAITDVRISLLLSCEKNGMELVQWQDEKQLKEQEYDRVTITGPTGIQEDAAVVPDAYCELKSAGRTLRFFIELDRMTVPISSSWWNRGWQRKAVTYCTYFQSGTYKKRYGTENIVLLTVTTTERRLFNMKRATEDVGGGERFLFSVLSDASNPEAVLNRLIWYVCGLDTPISILPEDFES